MRLYHFLRLVLKRIIDFIIYLVLRTNIIRPTKKVENVNKILLVNLQGIGDLIMSTPFYETILENFPRAKIDLISKKNNSDILTRKLSHIKFTSGYLALIIKIRNQKYNLAINLYRAQPSALLVLLSGARFKIGYFYSFNLSSNNLKLNKVNKSYDPRKKAVNIARALGLKNIRANDELNIYIPSKVIEDIKKNLSYEYVCINPNNEWYSRSWPKENWLSLVRELIKKYKVLIIGLKQEETSQYILDNINSENFVNMIGKTNIKETAALISMAKLFITCDSGPMHIAFATRTPTIAMFGPTESYVPLNNVVVLKNGICNCCWNMNNEPICKDNICMKSIVVEEVLKNII
jgi:heptosyltransferase I